MSKKTKKNGLQESYDNSMQHLRKFEFCKGRDGKGKDIYENFQAALDTAKFIEENRGIFLNVYECPYKNGWHLTKNNASTEIVERKEAIFQDNNIPLKSLNGVWEFIKDNNENDTIEEYDLEEIHINLKEKMNYKIPILKIECNSNNKNIEIEGKIMEIKQNIDVGKIFKINVENAFCISLLKNILGGIVDQITIYVKNRTNDNFDSYTILIKRDFLNKRIKKGSQIKISIICKSINNIHMWCCKKLLMLS